VYVLRQLQRVVGRAGFETVAVSSGRDALARLQEERFDLLVTDLYMPEVDGFELLVSTRIAPHFLPAIVISGNRETTGMIKALTSMGAVHTMNKPFSTAELVDSIVAIIGTPPGSRPRTLGPVPGAFWPDNVAAARVEESDGSPPLSRRPTQRILLVDENESALAQRQTALRHHGFDAAFAASGKTAIAVVRRENFDLVVTDLQLPDVDALDMLIDLRKTHRLLPVVVACTGRETLKRWTATMELGGMTTLWKPFDDHELLALVTAILGTTMLPPTGPIRDA
jgi:DNA-binding response OmpR family regulator